MTRSGYGDPDLLVLFIDPFNTTRSFVNNTSKLSHMHFA